MSRLAAAQRYLVPAAALLVAATLFAAGVRPSVVVVLPALVLAAVAHRLPRSPAAVAAFLLGVLSLGAGLISRADLLMVAGLLYLVAGFARGWGINRGRSGRTRAGSRIIRTSTQSASSGSSTGHSSKADDARGRLDAPSRHRPETPSDTFSVHRCSDEIRAGSEQLIPPAKEP